MKLIKEQREEVESLAKPFMKWLEDNTHPHTHIILDSLHAELVEGIYGFNREYKS